MNKKLNLEGNLFSMGNANQNENKKEIESETVSTSKSVSKSESKNVSNNSLTIKRKGATDLTAPMTYRLKITTIEQIRTQARNAGMGVTEYLQAVLDLVLDKIVIK